MKRSEKGRCDEVFLWNPSISEWECDKLDNI